MEQQASESRYDLKDIKTMAQELQKKFDQFEDIIEQYEVVQSKDSSNLMDIFLQEVKELVAYLKDRSQPNGKIYKEDHSLKVLLWAIEDSLWRMKR